MSNLNNLLGMMLAGQAAALSTENKWMELERVDKMRSDEFKEITERLTEQCEPYRKARWDDQKELNALFSEFDEIMSSFRERMNRYLEERYRRETKEYTDEYTRRANEINRVWRELHAKIHAELGDGAA